MTETERSVKLDGQFGIPGTVHFETGPTGLIRAAIQTPRAEAVVYLHGAHVTHYQPRGDRPVLSLSALSRFQADQPIRGGVPIVFPWFGPCREDAAAPMHGFARIVEWRPASVRQEADGAVVMVLVLDAGMATHPAWPHSFTMTYTVRIGAALDLMLEVRNPSDRPVTYEEALHTYLAVEDIHQVAVRGLAGTAYVDKTDRMTRKTQDAEPLRIRAEMNRVYFGTPAACVVEDSAGNRRLIVEKQGSDVTVVWNPWIATAKTLPDFGDDEWRRMLCVETANAADHPVRLAPGDRHLLRAVIRSEPM